MRPRPRCDSITSPSPLDRRAACRTGCRSSRARRRTCRGLLADAVTNSAGIRRVTGDRIRLQAAGELLRSLAAPVRLAVLIELSAAPRCVHELAKAVGVSQPLLSQHLRVLRAARLVTAERRGREVAYRLADKHASHIVTAAIRHVDEHPR
jgi:ArsR family transcriptional regulator